MESFAYSDARRGGHAKSVVSARSSVCWCRRPQVRPRAGRLEISEVLTGD